MLGLAGTTALLSAFLDNLTTILLIVPVTFLIADAFDIDPLPLVIIEVIASNIGGTATLIGDPPNIIIAGATELSFNDFLVNLAPVAALAFVVVVAFLYAVYRHRLRIRSETASWSWSSMPRHRSATPPSCGARESSSLSPYSRFSPTRPCTSSRRRWPWPGRPSRC